MNDTIQPPRHHSVDPSWPEQWRAYADIMDARLAVLQAHEYAPPGALDPAHVLTHAHVRDILQAIEAGNPTVSAG